MADRYEYEPGCCTTCRKETEVRWKNLYVIGSEGVWLCIKCEMKVVHFVRDLMRESHMAKKAEFIAERGAAECPSEN